MAKLKVGDRAPVFELQSETGETVSLTATLARGPVVLIFYPMDQTPGCTAQLCAARDAAERYAAAGVSVYGVNGAGAVSHKKFVEKHNLSTPLLVDSGLTVAAAYDAVLGAGPVKFVNRTVVGIAKDGTIALYERGMPSTDDILAAVAAAA
jgi:peroxiredoxin Q/BCP